MKRSFCILAVAAALLSGSAAEAAAQFTGVVQPPPASRRVQAAVARTDSASRAVGARDSANVTRLTDMKKWVDSATVAMTGRAADTVAARTTVTATAVEVDSAMTQTHTEVAAGHRRGSAGAQAMQDGARAPDTATPLPTIAVLGVVGLGLGLVLMGRRRSA